MATSARNKVADKKKTIIDKSVKDYSNAPFFIKKRETAAKLLKKIGLPDSVVKKK